MNTLALTAETSKMGIGDAGIAAVLGYAVVFLGLVLLMCVVIIMGKAMASTRNKAKAEASGTASPAAPAPAPTPPPAPITPRRPTCFTANPKSCTPIWKIASLLGDL